MSWLNRIWAKDNNAMKYEELELNVLHCLHDYDKLYSIFLTLSLKFCVYEGRNEGES